MKMYVMLFLVFVSWIVGGSEAIAQFSLVTKHLKNIEGLDGSRIVVYPELYKRNNPANPKAFSAYPPGYDEFTGDLIQSDYWISRMRPIIPIRYERNQIKGEFTIKTDKLPGAEPELVKQVENRWKDLQLYAGAVVYIEINPEQFGTGVHIGNGRILTAHHVATEIIPGSKVIRTGMHESNSQVLWNKKQGDRIKDIAILNTYPPLTSPSIEFKVVKQAFEKWNATTNTFLALLTYPRAYGDIKGEDFNNIFGPAGELRVCVGKLRSDILGANIARMSHDVPTHTFNSGSPVFDLLSGRLVGIHVSYEASSPQNYFTPLAGSHILEQVLSSPVAITNADQTN